MTTLLNKIAVVTGAGRGIGRAIAIRLADRGANVIVNDLDEKEATEVVRLIEKKGRSAHAVVGSVTNKAFPDELIERTVERYGCPDIIINNAGYTWEAKIEDISDEQFQAMIEVHLSAPFRILRAAQPHIKSAVAKERSANIKVHRKIVNISSVAGIHGFPTQTNYGSAKAGVVGLTKILAKEWGPMNVNVNCVAFGYIETRLTQVAENRIDLMVDGHAVKAGLTEKGDQAFKSRISLGRSGTVREAAGGVYFFCSPDSDYVTGQILEVSGGLVL